MKSPIQEFEYKYNGPLFSINVANLYNKYLIFFVSTKQWKQILYINYKMLISDI